MGYNTNTASVLIDSEDVTQIARIDRTGPAAGSTAAGGRWLRDFISELKRRRVCRVATIYTITLWLIAQIVDVVAEGIGLPDWTIKAVITLGLAGFPIALILSWLFDIVPERQLRTSSCQEAIRKRPGENIVDCGLLFVALLIATQVAFGAFDQPAATPQASTSVTVEPFRAASDGGADVFSVGLSTEIQHRLVSRPGIEVFSIDAVGLRKGWSRLSGTVVAEQERIRVTVSLIDGASGTVVWSQVFERDRASNLIDQQALAGEIVSSLPEDVAAG